MQDLSSGNFKAEFCPKIAGEHQIYISFREEQVPGSPFACKVYNVNAIKVRECVKGIVGKPVTFLVETSHAGLGNLEVTVNNGQVPTSAQAQGNHTYAISFNPNVAGYLLIHAPRILGFRILGLRILNPRTEDP